LQGEASRLANLRTLHERRWRAVICISSETTGGLPEVALSFC
jgi:hypothetical protein